MDSAQKAFRVDENLNIVEGLPFVERDPLVYQEQPDKLLRGRTNPYDISALLSMPSSEGKPRTVWGSGMAVHCSDRGRWWFAETSSCRSWTRWKRSIGAGYSMELCC